MVQYFKLSRDNMLPILLIGSLEFEVEPGKYYAILVLTSRDIDSIRFIMGDTSWVLFKNYNFHYTMFHTEPLSRSTIARIQIEEEYIDGLMVICADSIINTVAPSTIEYYSKIFTPMGIMVFPGVSSRLDSFNLFLEGRNETLRLPPEMIPNHEVFGILFSSGTRNILSLFGKGQFKILWGKALILH